MEKIDFKREKNRPERLKRELKGMQAVLKHFVSEGHMERERADEIGRGVENIIKKLPPGQEELAEEIMAEIGEIREEMSAKVAGFGREAIMSFLKNKEIPDESKTVMTNVMNHPDILRDIGFADELLADESIPEGAKTGFAGQFMGEHGLFERKELADPFSEIISIASIISGYSQSKETEKILDINRTALAGVRSFVEAIKEGKSRDKAIEAAGESAREVLKDIKERLFEHAVKTGIAGDFMKNMGFTEEGMLKSDIPEKAISNIQRIGMELGEEEAIEFIKAMKVKFIKSQKERAKADT